jgi:hypothetical protein
MSPLSASRSGVFSEQISVVSIWPVNGESIKTRR